MNNFCERKNSGSGKTSRITTGEGESSVSCPVPSSSLPARMLLAISADNSAFRALTLVLASKLTMINGLIQRAGSCKHAAGHLGSSLSDCTCTFIRTAAVSRSSYLGGPMYVAQGANA